MARTLSTAVANAVAAGATPFFHLLRFTVGATNYYFAEDQITHLGNTYKPHLILDAPARYVQKLQLEPVTVRLQNIDLATAKTLKTEQAAIQGQEATLSRLFLKAHEAVTLFVGQISEVEINERDATLTLVGDLDPTATQVPKRKYSHLCVWDFKDTNCGYVDGVDPNDPETGLPFVICPKDFLSCQARSREERFPGFIHITRDLTEAVEGQLPGYEEDDRALAGLYEP